MYPPAPVTHCIRVVSLQLVLWFMAVGCCLGSRHLGSLNGSTTRTGTLLSRFAL
jgi:hypothetical protein